jgi:D-alanyl-D-alanine carboxypeptidase (penicillin-binding protein 5/6)
MKKTAFLPYKIVTIFMCAIVIVFVLTAFFVFIENNSKTNSASAYNPPSRGSVLIECSTKAVLRWSGQNNRTYPASTTKILTALVVLEHLPLKLKVKVPKEAVGVEGSSLYLRQGEVLTVEDLLFGMMLRSGNDAAVALAVAVAGNVDNFAKLMNKRAVECGATNSNFVNPHGLHDENHYTTAIDLAYITAEAMKHNHFRHIVSMQKARIGEGESARVIGNKNKMLWQYDGANGVKTGYTKNSGRCLVSAAKINGMQLIAVVLNHPNMWADSTALLDYGFDSFEMVDVEALCMFGDYGQKAMDTILNTPESLRPKRYPAPKIALY